MREFWRLCRRIYRPRCEAPRRLPRHPFVRTPRFGICCNTSAAGGVLKRPEGGGKEGAVYARDSALVEKNVATRKGLVPCQSLVVGALETNDLAPLPFGGPSFEVCRIRVPLSLDQRRFFLPCLAALLGLAVEPRRLRRRAATLAQREHRDIPGEGSVAYDQRVSGLEQLRRLDPFTVHLRLPAVDRRCCQRAGLVKPRSPQPFVYSQSLIVRHAKPHHRDTETQRTTQANTSRQDAGVTLSEILHVSCTRVRR